MRKRVFVALSIALLAGCASIPLSTMWKMRNLTADTFFAKDPRALRVALRTDDRVTAGNPAIDIRIEGMSKKPICYAFALMPIDSAAPGEAPLEKSSGHRCLFVFALSKQGVDASDRARREVRMGMMEGGSLSLNVSMNEMDFPHNLKSLPIGIDVMLDRKDGYFT